MFALSHLSTLSIIIITVRFSIDVGLVPNKYVDIRFITLIPVMMRIITISVPMPMYI